MAGSAGTVGTAGAEAIVAGQRSASAAQLALLAVTATAVLSWFRLFNGYGWLVPLLAVAVTGHAVAAAARRAHLAVAVSILLSLVATVFVYCWAAVPSTTAAGLPGPATLDTLARQLTAAREAFRTVQAPTAALGGFVVVLAALVWIVTVASDWLAFRLQARAEALVPAGGLFLIGTILGVTERRTAAVLVFAPAVLAFILLHRISATQRPANRLAVGDGGRRRLLGAGTALAVASVVIGTVAAGALPGANRHTLLDWRQQSSDAPRVTLSPLVNIRSNLTSGADELLFTVRADRPSYWRLSTLDQFDGQVWGSSGTYGSTSKHLPGTKQAYGGHWSELAQSYSITGLSQVWAPAAALPASISEASVALRWDATSQTLIVAADDATTDGAAYTVVSKVPALTAAVLEQASGAVPASILKHDTALPPSLPTRVRDIALQVTAGAHTPYDEAIKLQQYFRDNPHFRYSTDPNLGESSNAMLAFLDSGEGFCEQFSGTYAAMARSIGLATRIAVGFTPGVIDPHHPGQFLVYGRQYHAWPEVYFSGIGWVAFEPTPGRGAPENQAYTGVPPEQDTGVVVAPALGPAETAPPTTVPGATGPQAPTTTVAPATPPTQAAPLPPPANPAHRASSGIWRWLLLALAIMLALAAALFSVPGCFFWRRRRRRAGAHTAPERIALAWLETCEMLSLVTPPPQPADTRLEFARRASPVVPGIGGALTALAQIATGSAWADDDLDGDSERAERLASEISARVRTLLGRWGMLRRLVGWQLLRPSRRVSYDGYSSRWNRSRIRSVVVSR